MPAERRSPQARINARSLEVVGELRGDLAGHKEMDAMQFANVRAELTEIKADIKTLNQDAKKGLDDLRRQQAENHQENSDKLAEVIKKQAGNDGFWSIVARTLPIILSAGTLAFLIWGRHP